MVESEGKRSSMRQMVPDGWALDTVPAGLVQTAPSMLGPWNHPTSHLIKCRGVNIEGAVHARRFILNCPRRAAPRARVCHQSVRKSFVRDCSLHVPPRPVAPSTTGSCRTISETPMFWLKGPSRSAALSTPRAPASLACVYSRRPPMGDLDELKGLPRWPAGGSPKCHTVVQRSHFGGHFGTPFGAELAHRSTKSSKMGVQKVVKTGPLGRVLGELGCLLFLLRVFKTNLL